MVDFRTSSYCNTLNKCIKRIAKRISISLPSIVDRSQAVFIKDRSISDNILMAQNLQGYNSRNGSAKATLIMELHKVFDSCHWKFIINVLILRRRLLRFILLVLLHHFC